MSIRHLRTSRLPSPRQGHAAESIYRPGITGSRPRRHAPRAAGFSFLEIMIVVAISVVMVAVSLPYISNTMSSMYLGSAASALSAEFAAARYQAIASACPVQLTVNSQSYQVAGQCIIGSTGCPATGTAGTCGGTFYNWCAGAYSATATCPTPFANAQISVAAYTPANVNVIYFYSSGIVTTAASGGVPTTYSVQLAQLKGSATKTVNISGTGYVKTTTP